MSSVDKWDETLHVSAEDLLCLELSSSAPVEVRDTLARWSCRTSQNVETEQEAARTTAQPSPPALVPIRLNHNFALFQK